MAKKRKKKTLQKSIEELAEEVRLLREENELLRQQKNTGTGIACGPNCYCQCGNSKYPDADQCEECGRKGMAWDDGRGSSRW